MSTRYQRRRLKHTLAKLQTERERAHEKLIEAEQRQDLTITETIAEIEEFVDALGKEICFDDKRDFGPSLDDPRLYTLIARVGWRGVTTPEAAKEMVLEEVARRSVSRTDLALLLSSIDHTAILLWGNLPDSLRDLHGEALIEAGVERLTLDDFESDLVRDVRWVEMRGRWIRMGWRAATTEEEFSREFVRAVVERVVLIQDAQGDDIVRAGLSLMHDTVIDDQLNRARPEARVLMEKAFKERLDREWDQLSRPRVAGVPASYSIEKEMGDLRHALDRTDDLTSRANLALSSGVKSLIVRDYVPEVEKTSPVPTVIYSDHALMRHGRELWEITYADGMTDEEVRDTVCSAVVKAGGGLWSDAVSFFTAKWAVHAFQRLMTSHTFAAALMCSDVQREVLEGIEAQWDAFIVLVPNGMLLAGGFEFSRVLVATYSFGAWLGLIAPDGAGFRLLVDTAPSLPALLASDETDLVLDSPSQRCLVMAKRLVAGLLLNLQDAATHKIRKVEARAKSKNREAEPEHRIVTIGAPLEIDCRDAVKEYIEHGTRSSEKTGRRHHGTPTVQWMVRGHFRMQAHGPRHTLRRKTWIRPHWQGYEAALIQTRARVPS